MNANEAYNKLVKYTMNTDYLMIVLAKLEKSCYKRGLEDGKNNRDNEGQVKITKAG